jgi:hypothetical protein
LSARYSALWESKTDISPDAANDAAVAFDIYQVLKRTQENEVSLPNESVAEA